MIRFGQPASGFDQGLQNRLQIESRPTDGLQDVCGRGLLPKRFLQIFCARLDLIKQTRILNRYHRLVSKGRHQLDLLLREGLNGLAAEKQRAHRLIPSYQGNTKEGAESSSLLHIEIAIFRVVQHIGDLNGLHCEQRPSDHTASARLQPVHVNDPDPIDREIVVRRVVEAALVLASNGRHIRVAQPSGGLSFGLQNLRAD